MGISALAGRFIPDLPAPALGGYAFSGLLLVTALVRPFAGLVLLTLATLLAPETVLGETGGRDITIRMDDLFVVCLAVGWLGHCAVVRETPLVPGTPFTRLIGWYLGIATVATFRGVFFGWLNPLNAFFHLAKFTEYFLVLFLTVAIVRTEREARVILWTGLATALIIAWIGWGMYRRGGLVSVPFQREGGEGATYGAYMILVMGLLGGLLLESRLFLKLLGAALLAWLFPPFLYSMSRASYMGLAVCSLTLLAVARRGRIWLLPLVVAGAWLLIVHPPLEIKQKMESTFVGAGGTFFGHDIAADESVYERLFRYEKVLKAWVRHPFLGFGVTGPAFVEGIFITELGQGGLVGLGLFLAIAWRVLRFGWEIRSGPHPPWLRGLGQGLVAAYAGLLGHAATANTFHLIRVSEPLWLTVGVLFVLQRQSVNRF